jgi:hypothetical protein
MFDDRSSCPQSGADPTQNNPPAATSDPAAEIYEIAPASSLQNPDPEIVRTGDSLSGDAGPHGATTTEVRFSLLGLLACLALLAGVLAIGRTLPLPLFAGLTGVAVIVGQIAISALRVRWPLAHLAWWLLLGVYLVASACAVAARSH